MNKDNILFTACGFILGLIAGTLLLGPMLHQRGVVPAIGAPAAQSKMPADAAHGAAAPATAMHPGGDPNVMQQVLQQIGVLKQRLEQNPRDAQAAIQLGNLYMDARKFDQAISYYERALAIAPNPDVSTDLGICYRAKGEPQRALEIFRSVSRANPQHWQSRFNEAIVLMDMGDVDSARNIVTALQKQRPEDPDVKRFADLLAQMKKS